MPGISVVRIDLFIQITRKLYINSGKQFSELHITVLLPELRLLGEVCEAVGIKK